jgi:hypothetical protein
MRNKEDELKKLFLSKDIDESPKVKIKGLGETCLVRLISTKGEDIMVVDDSNNGYDLGELNGTELNKFIKILG